MKVVLDTNVLVSGIFFSGPPAAILRSWSQGKFKLVTTPEIIEEYRRVASILSDKFPEIDIGRILDLIIMESEVYFSILLSHRVCADPDDDKFLAAAITSGAKVIGRP
jgi:putative PIN family toxin of toxin-antitoxin system